MRAGVLMDVPDVYLFSPCASHLPCTQNLTLNKQCNKGFHFSSTKGFCRVNKCVCIPGGKSGNPKDRHGEDLDEADPLCPDDGAYGCKQCHAGYTHDGKKSCAPNQCYCENGKPVKSAAKHCPPVPKIDQDIKATRYAMNKPETDREIKLDPQAPAGQLEPTVMTVDKGRKLCT